jgi:glycine/D-amino acid oxidase-like deaminating enzyme
LSELPSSYWFSRSTTREEADVVVVGAGFVGASTAWWARRAGRRVLVLDAQRVAAGATGRSTGFLVTGGPQPFARLAGKVGEERALRLWELSQENLGLLRRELLTPARVECGWRPEGSWRTAPAGSPAETEWEQSAERLARHGFAVDWWDAAATRRAAGSPSLGGALHVEGDGGLDPVTLCRGLLSLSGAEVRQGVAVRGLEAEGDRARLTWPGGELLARAVVLAVNAHIGPLVPALAARLQPMGVQALATAPVPRSLSGVWGVATHGFYLRQLDDGTLMAASGGSAAEGGFVEAPTAAGQARLEATLGELFPQLERPPVLHRWAGTIGVTADGLPWMRSVPGVSAAAYACGFNGGGMSLGFALGRRLARWVGDGDERHLAAFQAGVPAPASASP